MSSIVVSLESMREYFEAGNTLSYAFRKAQLQQLKTAILAHEQELNAALFSDLRKSREEVWITETGMVLSEIDYFVKHLEEWMKPKKVGTNLLNLPGKSYIMPEPRGVVLIIGPWNYPFQLLFMPLVGAIAAGNCVVLKPSEFAVETSKVMGKIIGEVFHFTYIRYVNGDGAAVVPEMMNGFRFDHVFYTGSTAVGKKIYEMAASQLVPVTLELGGKSPCVVTANANLKVAARRIASVKFSNAGQMCIAPDYILVQESVKEALVQQLKEAVQQFYGDQAVDSYDYGRIINEKQFSRLLNYLKDARILHGGAHNEALRYIGPTIIDQPATDDAVMKEEIFGPVLPVIAYRKDEEAVAIIRQLDQPLAFYIFTDNKQEADGWLQKIPSGNAAVNAAAVFYLNKNLPFGGRGGSGMGRYHGWFSFETFSHQKAVLKRPTWPDLAVAYPSFKGKLSLLKKFF